MKQLKIILFILLFYFLLHSIVIELDLIQTIIYYLNFPFTLYLYYCFFKNVRFLPVEYLRSIIFPIVFFIIFLYLHAFLGTDSNVIVVLRSLIGINHSIVLPLLMWMVALSLSYRYFNNINNLFFKKISFAVIVVSVVSFLGFYNSMSNNVNFAYQWEPYILSCLVPFVFLYYRKINWIYIFCLLVIMVVSKKRGPLVGLVFGYLFTLIFSSYSKWAKLFVIFLSAILLYLLPYLLPDYMISSFVDRFDTYDFDVSENENFGSGRGIIWDLHYKSYFDGSLSQRIFGFGPRASAELTKNLFVQNLSVSAHNAYIFFVYQYGIIGLVFYVYFLIYNFRYAYKALKKKFKYSSHLIFVIIYLIVTSFFTVHFEFYPILFIMYILGLLLGVFQATKRKL